MGHMSLISEEIVKLFHHYPIEIHSILRPHIPPAWEEYVKTTLRKTRELDLTPLGNFGNGRLDAGDSGSSSASGASGPALSDEDDEFPSSRTVRGGNGFLEQEVASTKEIDPDSGDQVSPFFSCWQ